MSERPDTAALLSEVRDIVRKYVVLPDEHFYFVVALWVLHTHAIAAADTTPRLVFKSPEKESGKTRALEVVEMLASDPINTINATVPAIYRRLEENQATVLWDEADAIFSAKAAKDHEDTRALINAGYRRGATALRVVGVGTKMRSKEFPVFAPMALASIGDLPDTIESRGIVVPMRRRAPHEQVEQFRRRWALAETGNLRDSLAEWAHVYVAELTDVEPMMPDTITDRAADIWEPLFAIADLAGDEWPKRVRVAACEIVAGRLSEDQSLGIRLLADIRTVMGAEDRMASMALVAKLNAIEESGWGGWNDGKGMSPRELARRLKHHHIEPKTMRVPPDDSLAKAYEREAFLDAWSRYLRVTDVTDDSDPIRNKNSNTKTSFVTDVTHKERVEANGSSQDSSHVYVPDIGNKRNNTPKRVQNPVTDWDATNGNNDLDAEQLAAIYPDAEVVG